MSGYFGIGVESSSKEFNAGNLVRTTHAFGGSFFFFVNPVIDYHKVRATDTSKSVENLPIYQFDSHEDMILPQKCALVGVELTDEAIDLPRFRHPKSAAYILGPERGNLSKPIQDKCDMIVKIPMKFCVNVGVAGALVVYDRLISRGHFPDRPVSPVEHMNEMKKFRMKF